MTIKTDYRIPSALDGYTLLLRNKRLQQEEREGPRKTVLFVHGATYGSSDTFDYQTVSYTHLTLPTILLV